MGLTAENSTLGPEALFRIAQLLSHQQRNKIHHLNVVLGQRLLAVPEDEMMLYNAINVTFRGGIKPMMDDVELGSKTRCRGPSTGGHPRHQ